MCLCFVSFPLNLSQVWLLYDLCSLQITPACNLPLKCLRGGGKIVIVNLQVLLLSNQRQDKELDDMQKMLEIINDFLYL